MREYMYCIQVHQLLRELKSAMLRPHYPYMDAKGITGEVFLGKYSRHKDPNVLRSYISANIN